MISPFSLQWSTSSPTPSPLPDGIERTYVASSHGNLELLSAVPAQPMSDVTLFFVHGGFGSAAVWSEYLSFFSGAGIPSYAISLRGHGASYRPGFWRMVYGTSRKDLLDDVSSGLQYVSKLQTEASRPVNICLVGHSSGGGLAQALLDEGRAHVAGLVLLGSVPGFGSLGVYMNWWFRIDPWSLPRLLPHLYHPASPLSTIRLIRNVFFTSKKHESEIISFRKNMPGYESLIWAMSMMRRFVDPTRVLQNIFGSRQKLLVLGGSEDKLCSPNIMEDMAAWYRQAASRNRPDAGPRPDRSTIDDYGVAFRLEPGAHHLQNDVQWRASAQSILNFCEQLL